MSKPDQRQIYLNDFETDFNEYPNFGLEDDHWTMEGNGHVAESTLGFSFYAWVYKVSGTTSALSVCVRSSNDLRNTEQSDFICKPEEVYEKVIGFAVDNNYNAFQILYTKFDRDRKNQINEAVRDYLRIENSKPSLEERLNNL